MNRFGRGLWAILLTGSLSTTVACEEADPCDTDASGCESSEGGGGSSATQYFYVRVDDMGDESPGGSHPGSDIDAVMLLKANGTHYAAQVADVSASAVGNPEDSVGAPDAACQPETTGFVSLGGLGGYIVLAFTQPIEPGDELVILEVGNNPCGPGAEDANNRVQVSLSEDGSSNWQLIGESNQDGAASLTVPAQTPASPAAATAQTDCSLSYPELVTALGLAQLMGITVADVCASTFLTNIVEFVHSASAVATTSTAGNHSTIRAVQAVLLTLGLAELNRLFLMSEFECGAGPNGFTLCQPGSAPAEEDYVVVFNVLEGDVPIASPDRVFQYGFVFEVDGNAANNYTPGSSFPNDLFRDTDLWYEAAYSYQSGQWELKTTDARNGTFTPFSSNARIVIQGNVIMAVIPTSELGTSTPSYRVTAFSHTGNYGLQSDPFEGSVHPAVDQPLLEL